MAVRHIYITHDDLVNELAIDGQECDSPEQVIDILLSAYRNHVAQAIRFHNCAGPDCRFEGTHYKILSAIQEVENYNKQQNRNDRNSKT